MIYSHHTVNTKQIAWTTNSKDMSKNRTINVKDQSRNSKKIKNTRIIKKLPHVDQVLCQSNRLAVS
jgi:hypothetical protein